MSNNPIIFRFGLIVNPVDSQQDKIINNRMICLASLDQKYLSIIVPPPKRLLRRSLLSLLAMTRESP